MKKLIPALLFFFNMRFYPLLPSKLISPMPTMKPCASKQCRHIRLKNGTACVVPGTANAGPANLPARTNSINTCPLAKKMLGWHAIGTSSASYVWQSLSDLSYFSYDVNKATGAPINTAVNNFATDPTVLAAKANGVNVSLCVTLFNNSIEFFYFLWIGGSPKHPHR